MGFQWKSLCRKQGSKMKSVHLTTACFGLLVATNSIVSATETYSWADTTVASQGYTPAPKAVNWLRERQDGLFGIPLSLLVPVGLAAGNALYTTAQANAINSAVTSLSSRVDDAETRLTAVESTASSTSSTSSTVCTQLKAILDESAIGTQTISAATTDTTAAQLTSTQTAITAIQAKVDAIIDGTISSCS